MAVQVQPHLLLQKTSYKTVLFFCRDASKCAEISCISIQVGHVPFLFFSNKESGQKN